MTAALAICARDGLVGLALFVAGAASAQAQTPVPPRDAEKANLAESGVRWQQLTAAQRGALKPLERDWAGIDASGKQKWIELSARVPSMSDDERARVQTRMAEWARMTPRERGQARLNFEEVKQLPSKDRQQRWEAYQALSPEQRRELADRAAPAEAPRRPVPSNLRLGDGGGGREAAQGKSNIVPNPAFAAPPRPIAPTIVQAQPGATTTLVTKRPVPPAHQQTGMPKIVATPEFVDRATLLPQRGPQGAAARSAPPSDPAAGPRR